MNALMPSRRARPISLTALIDVVFILLMFFMLTSGFSQWVTLPLNSKAGSQTAVPDDQPLPQLLVLKNDGGIRFFDQGAASADQPPFRDANDLDELTAVIDTTRELVVLPEADVQVQRIVTSMSQLAALAPSALTLGQALDNTGTDQGDAQHE